MSGESKRSRDHQGVAERNNENRRSSEVMRAGGRVCRHGWNGRDMWIALQEPDAHTKMSLPYVYMRTAQGGTVPWLCSQSDLLADDWDIAR